MQDLLVFLAILIPFFKRLTSVLFFGDAFDSFLSELPHAKELADDGPGHILPLTALDDLQIFDLVQLHTELVLREEGVFLDQSRDMFQPI